jgi:hypothetical protein
VTARAVSLLIIYLLISNHFGWQFYASGHSFGNAVNYPRINSRASGLIARLCRRSAWARPAPQDIDRCVDVSVYDEAAIATMYPRR